MGASGGSGWRARGSSAKKPLPLGERVNLTCLHNVIARYHR